MSPKTTVHMALGCAVCVGESEHAGVAAAVQPGFTFLVL